MQLTAPSPKENFLSIFKLYGFVFHSLRIGLTVSICELTAQARKVHVIGTTGFNAKQEEQILAAARHATIIKSGNMSLGVNALLGTVELLSNSLDNSWDIEISDAHHRDKVDSPSGTALDLAEAAALGLSLIHI